MSAIDTAIVLGYLVAFGSFLFCVGFGALLSYLRTRTWKF